MRNKYLDRLIEEWNQHGKIIIAVDWDDTLQGWKYSDLNDVIRYNRLWQLLIECRRTGAYIVLFTACNADRHESMLEYARGKGLIVDGINRTPINSIPYGRDGSKIYANIYLDDRAGLEEATALLEKALYLRRSEMQQELHNYPGSLG